MRTTKTRRNTKELLAMVFRYWDSMENPWQNRHRLGMRDKKHGELRFSVYALFGKKRLVTLNGLDLRNCSASPI
jgi:hypothetical protein